jgi:hypothetical protein
MADQENPNFGFEYLASKALFDPAFTQALFQNPAQALQSIGIEPTPELLDAIEKVDVASIQAVAEAFKTGPQVGQA